MNSRAFVVACLVHVACASPGADCSVDERAICASRTCGSVSATDACGESRTIECGTCDASLTCSAIGQCIDPSCEPESDAELCGRDLECGAHERTDRCGQLRTLACGTCSEGLACSAIGQCIDENCVPESDADLCARSAVTCGSRTALDNCGQSRTVRCGDPCPAGGGPGWSGEFEVSDPVYGNTRESFATHVVDVGTHYLAVWEDGRSDGSGWASSEPILAARVAYDGRVLDPGGIMLAEPGTAVTIDALLYDGTDVVLVMTERVSEETRTIALLRLDRDGRPRGERVDVVTDNLYNVVAAFDGTNVVLAWARDGGGVRVTPITPGTLALGTVHELSSSYSLDLSLAVRDGRSMLAWSEYTAATSSWHLRTSMLASDYSPTVPGGVEISDAVGPVSNADHTLHTTATGFALLHEHRDAAAQRVRMDATFFDPEGAPIAGSPLALYEKATSVSYSSFYASASSFGSSLLVVLTANNRREGLVIDPSTRSISAGPIVLEDSGYAYGQISCHTTECLVSIEGGSWEQARLDRYTPTFARTGSFYPAVVAAHQYRSAVAFDGDQYAVMWSEGPASELSGTELRMRRLSPDGAWLDATPILVPGSGAPRWSFGVEAYASGGFLVHWIEEDATYRESYFVRRMNADGTWAWPAVRLDLYPSSFARFGPSACAGDRCIVTFVRTIDRWEYLILDGDGTELTEPAVIPGFTNDQVAPAIHFDGTTFWIAFHEDDAVHVRAIAASGASIGQLGTEHYEVPAIGGVYRAGPILWHRFGTETLLLSGAALPDASTPDGIRALVEARTLSAGVGLSAPITIADDVVAAHELVGAVSDGSELQVVYLGVSPLFFPTGSLEQLYVARYDRALGRLDPGSALFPGAWFEDAVMVTNGNRALLSYGRIDWDVGFGGERVRATFVGDRSYLQPDDAACVDDGQCGGARCRALQCCDECSLWKGL